MRNRLLLMPGLLVLAAASAARAADGSDAEYLRRQIPTEIAGTYSQGALVKLTHSGGLGHGGNVLYQSRDGLEFLLRN